MLQVLHLQKVFYPPPLSLQPPLPAVHDISFSLAVGEGLGLLGESGGGKTTVARMLLGLIPPTGGKIRYNLPNLKRFLPAFTAGDWRHLHHHVQWTPQDADESLDPQSTAYASIAQGYQAQYPHLRSQQRQEYVAQLCYQLVLAPHKWRLYPPQLSGGEKRRVVLARALAALGYGQHCNYQQYLLIADEPTSGLDMLLSARVHALLQQLHQHGLALLLITHNLLLLRKLTSRVLVIYQGHVVEEGQTQLVLRASAPHHPFTAQLLSAADELTSRIHPPADNQGARGAGAVPISKPTPTLDIRGCSFYPCCHLATKDNSCQQQLPSLHGDNSHRVACWHISQL